MEAEFDVKKYNVYLPVCYAKKSKGSSVSRDYAYYNVVISGQKIYIDDKLYDESGAEGEFSSWYCTVVINTEDKKAYMILPPTSANDVKDKADRRMIFAANGVSDGNDIISAGKADSYYDYLNTPAEAGRKNLVPFQLYVQDDDANLGYYDTVLLAVNEDFNSKEYKVSLKSAMGRVRNPESDGERPIGKGETISGTLEGADGATYTLYDGCVSEKNGVLSEHRYSRFGTLGIEYGYVCNGEDTSNVKLAVSDDVYTVKYPEGTCYNLLDAERCVCTPIAGDDVALLAAQEFANLFSVISMNLGEEPEKCSLGGFLSAKVKPFGNCVPQTHKEFLKHFTVKSTEGTNEVKKSLKVRLGEIEKIESIAKFVPGTVAAKAVAFANSRLYALWKSGVYVSGFNNYADFAQKFDDEVDSAEPWSSLSTGDPSTLGEFVAVIPYGNKVLCFKENCTMEIRGSTAPFTLVASCNVGAVGSAAVTVGDGYVIFVGKDNVYLYTGNEPEALGNNLCLKDVSEACIVAEGEYLYVCIKSEKEEIDADKGERKQSSYVLSMENGCWGRLDLPEEARFAKASDGIYALAKTDGVYDMYKLGMQYPEYWFFETGYASGGTYEDLILSGIRMIFDSRKGSWLRISLRCYGDEEYTEVFYRRMDKDIEKEKTQISFRKRCSGYQVKVEGSLYSCIYALDITQRVVRGK